MIEFEGNADYVHLWRDYYLQQNSYVIVRFDSKGVERSRIQVKPQITDRASIPSWVEAVPFIGVKKDWINKSAGGHDQSDRETWPAAVLSDVRFAIWAGSEMLSQGIPRARLRAVLCFLGVQWGWLTGFNGSPSSEVYQVLSEKIRAGEVPMELSNLITEHQDDSRNS
ncbi:MAG: hypothetical protein AAFX93_19675 [Verrucomicrobiota bacterium]